MDKKDFILVTGAGGFIGSNLTEELVKRGFKVRVLLKTGETDLNIRDLIKSKKIDVVVGDLLNVASLKKACKNINIVFHLAAKADLEFDVYEPYFKTNVLGTKNLVSCCDEKLKHFVFYSSILAVGLPNTSRLLDESYIGLAQHAYGRSKKEAEEYLLNEYLIKNFPITIFRPTTVYGPKELAVQYFLFKTIQDGKFMMIGNGKNLMSYIYVKNLVDATIKVVDSKKALGQIYFMNDKRPYSFKEVVAEIYKVMGKKPPIINIPFLVAYLGAALFQSVCNLVKVKPLIYPSRVKTMVLNYAYSIKKAEKDFGYQPKYDLASGIKESYDWYKRNGYLK